MPARSLTITACTKADESTWDAFVADPATNGTFIQTQRYLRYHGDRFDDQSLVVRDDTGRTLAVLAAVRSEGDPDVVVSHPGITFGGLVYDRRLSGDDLLNALRQISVIYRERGFRSLDYRPVPAFLRPRLGDEDVYGVLRLGGTIHSFGLTTVVDLARRPPVPGKRRNLLRKAERSGVTVESGAEHLATLWPVLEQQLRERHGVGPVHSLPQIEQLAAAFPEEITCHLAKGPLQEVLGGAVVYAFGAEARHTQYLVNTPAGRSVAALDCLCEHLIGQALDAGCRWFSFGVSTVEGGRVLNDSLHFFKASFGGDGVTVPGLNLTL